MTLNFWKYFIYQIYLPKYIDKKWELKVFDKRKLMPILLFNFKNRDNRDSKNLRDYDRK